MDNLRALVSGSYGVSDPVSRVGFVIKGLRELDESGTVAAAVACVRTRKAADCQLLEYAAHWAVLNPGDGLCPPATRLEIAGERAMLFGGDGTPDVAETAPGRLGVEIGLNVHQAVNLIADALDLKFRFPRIWERVVRVWVDAWKARLVAKQTRHLSKAQCEQIDSRLAHHLNKAGRVRLENLIDAEILRVDAERVRENTQKLLRARAVRLGRTDQSGLKDLWISIDAPEALWFKATVSRLADILMDRDAHHRLPAGVRPRGAQTKDEWESVAVGVLGRPLLAARILVEDQQLDLFSDLAAGYATPEPEPALNAAEPQAIPDQEDLPDHVASEAGRQSGVETPIFEEARRTALAAFVKAIDPERFLPTCVLHVHVSDYAIINADLTANGDDPDATVARIETLGPALLDVVRDWLGEAVNVRLLPHLNPATIPPLDAYEIPDRMRDTLLARSPASVFPYSSSTYRNMDIDHTVPYRPPPQGPPGQTGMHGLGPLNRREHRVKTFGDIRVVQVIPGIFLWRTAFGRTLVVDPSGTTDLGTGAFADALWRLGADGRFVTAA